MGFAAGHQAPQRPDRKSRTVITKLLSYINVEGNNHDTVFNTDTCSSPGSFRQLCHGLTWKRRLGN